MLEGKEPYHDQTTQVNVPLHVDAGSSNREFLELAQRQTLTYEGDPSVRAILEQFRGTPISEVFDDFPEGASITASQLRNRIHRQLTHSPQQIKVSPDIRGGHVANRREMGMRNFLDRFGRPIFYDRWREDEDITDEALYLAQPIRETILRLIPVAQDNADSMLIEFTPVVKTDRQLIVYEWRCLRMYINPAESTQVHEITEEQFTPFTRDRWGGWRQLGVLPFSTLSEYEDKPLEQENTEFGALEERLEKLEKAREEPTKKLGIPSSELCKGNAQTSDIHRQFYELEQQIAAVHTERQHYKLTPSCSVTVVLETPHASVLFNEGVNKPGETHIIEAWQQRQVFATLPNALNFPSSTHES